MRFWAASITRAPNFCAVSYINTFAGFTSHLAQEKWPRMSNEQKEDAALTFVKDLMGENPHENRTKYLICDVVDDKSGKATQGMHKYITPYLPKEFKFNGHRYVVEKGTPYKNFNTERTVMEVAIVRQGRGLA